MLLSINITSSLMMTMMLILSIEGGRPNTKVFKKQSIQPTPTIKKQSVQSTEEHMNLIRKRLIEVGPELMSGLRENGFSYVDNLLGFDTCQVMRREAEQYFFDNHYSVSQSTRFDADSNKVVAYNKHNVHSMQLDGDDLYYKGPRLHEYVVALVGSIVPILNDNFSDLQLTTTKAANKLAVCTGDGSHYDKHFDNMGNNDLRKITVIYYLQGDKYRTELGGNFKIFEIKDGASVVDQEIEPLSDRLLVFFSDSLVHAVAPSYATNSDEYRYALTVWLLTNDVSNIIINEDYVKSHFGINSDVVKGVNG